MQLTSEYANWPKISPHGKLIAFGQIDTAHRLHTAVMPFEGGAPIKILDIPTPWTIRWVPDGRSLTFLSSGDKYSNIWLQSLSGNKPTSLTKFTDQVISDYARSKKGDHLALARERSLRDAVLLKLK